MRRLALLLIIAPLGVALLVFGPQLAGRALLALGLPAAAAGVFADPAW
jgi:Ca-activated chloride channel family protein